jgi:hypothetical protein
VKNVQVIHAGKRDSAYIFVEAEAPGNAVVNMRVGSPSGPIYWSFHLWVTEYNPYEAAGQKFAVATDNTGIIELKNVYMDRNLGAMSNTYDASDVAGTAHSLYYQFGRKDPFPALLSPYTPSSQTPATTKFRPMEAIRATIQHPMTFYTRGSVVWSLVQENMNIWNTSGNNKTAYDPCPEGWRIPVQTGLQISPFIGSLGSSYMFDSIHGGKGTNSTVLGYFPHNGYINTAGVLDSIGTHTYIWSSFANSTYPNLGQGLFIRYISTPPLYHYTVSGEHNNIFDKSLGVSVRCVVDKNYIIRKENGGLFGNEVSRLRGVLLP